MNQNERIDLVLERFILRDDVYAVQWFDEERGTGYRRVTQGTCPNNPPCPKRSCTHIQNVPITRSKIAAHLQGDITLGIYQLSEDNYVKWLCFDVDIEKNAPDTIQDLEQRARDHTFALAKLLYVVLGKNGFLVERSGSKGYHLWVFFEKAQARYAFALGQWIVHQLDTPKHINVEVFPKQTALRSYGNLVKLPLGIHKKTKNRCLFVNGSFEEHEDQWSTLANVRVFTEQQLARILHANKIEPPVHIRIDRATNGNFGLPCMARIMREGLVEGNRENGMFALANYLRDHALPENAARAVLIEVNGSTTPPLRDDELDKNLDSAYNGDYTRFPCNDRSLDSYCSSACRFWNNKVRDRWSRYGKDAQAAIGTISRD